MDIETFSARRVNQLRRSAHRASEFQAEAPEGWSKSQVDPNALLRVFTSLGLRDGFTLRAYQFRADGNGNAFLYAVPALSPFPEPQACPCREDHFLSPPILPGALPEVMQAITGNSTPWSYLQASLFAREAAEFGAMWHGCDWSTHKILGANPLVRPGSHRGTVRAHRPEGWTWLDSEPQEWLPNAAISSGVITVTMYTFSALGQERIVRHTDVYTPESYHFRTESTLMALGPAGFIF